MWKLLLLALPLVGADWQAVEGWKPAKFPRQSEIKIEGRRIELPPGAPMTGVTASEFAPRINYEVRFEATRVKGNDFFCSLTFPYQGTHATWVNGGWGGDIVGISSVDNWDASENETRTYFNFENGRKYKFRIEVREGRIRTFIDEQMVVDLAVNGRAIGLRRGMDVTVPFTLFTYNTAAVIENVEYRVLASR